MNNTVRERSRAGERGAISIRAAVMIVIAGTVLFLLVKLAPVYMEQRKVIYDVEELARIAAVRGWKEDKIAPELNKIRGNYELPEGSLNLLDRDQAVHIAVGYTRKIDLLVTTYEWKVEHKVTGKEL